MSLFQDTCSNFVYSYHDLQPKTYASTVAGLMINGATYDTSANANAINAINGTDISFNSATSSYLSIQLPVNLPTVFDGSGYSFSGWFYPVGAQITNAVLIDISGAGLARSSVYYTGTNTISTCYNGGGSNTIISSVPSQTITPGQWHFFCYTVRCTSNGGGGFLAKESLYIDGNPVVSNMSTDYLGFTVLSKTIGGKPSLTGSYFTGNISEIRYYARVLNQSEVKVLYKLPNYISYKATLTNNPTTIQATYDTVKGAVLADGLGQYGTSVQIDLSGTFSYVDVSRNPAFTGGLPIYNLNASALIPANASSTSFVSDASGNLFFIDNTVAVNQQYTYAIRPHIRDISNQNTLVQTVLGATTITTPPIAILTYYDISSGAYTSKTTGINGSVIQIDISGVFSTIDISRNPAFTLNGSTFPGTSSFATSTAVLTMTNASILSNITTAGNYPTYLLSTTVYLNTASPQTGTAGLAFVDTTAIPGTQYTYTFTPGIVGSLLVSTRGSQNTTISASGLISSITAPPIAMTALYDLSAGAILGKTVGNYGASVQIDLSGSFTAVDVSRNPPFQAVDLSLNTGTTTFRIYDASAALPSSATGNAYITNALAYTQKLTPTVGGISEVFVDKTAIPNTTYTYYMTPYIKTSTGSVLTVVDPSTSALTITTPPIKILAQYDLSAGAILGKTVGNYGASVQIDLSGSFTAVDVSRNPPFQAVDLSLNVGTTTFRIYDASAALPVTGNAYITNALAYTQKLTPTVGGISEVFVDKTAIPNTTYTYYMTPYIKAISGSVSTVVDPSTSALTITTPPIKILAQYDLSAGAILGKTVGNYGASVQIDLSGIFTAVDVSRNPPFQAVDLSLNVGTTTFRIYDASAALPITGNAYITNALAYTQKLTPTVGGISEVFVDKTAIPNTTYTYYMTPYIKTSAGSVSTVVDPSTSALTVTTPQISMVALYDLSAGALIGDSIGNYGASVQIDLSGSFTAVDVSRNPPFLAVDLSLNTGTTTFRIYDASAALPSTGNAYITNALAYTQKLTPTVGGISEVFVDKTAIPNTTYSYYMTPYIKTSTGSVLTVVDPSTSALTITTPPVALKYVYVDPSFGIMMGTGVGNNGASIQIDLSGNITGIDISRNPAFTGGTLRFPLSSTTQTVSGTYLTMASTSFGTSLAIIDNSVYLDQTYQYYIRPYIKNVYGNISTVSANITTGTGIPGVDPTAAYVPTTNTLSTVSLTSTSIPGITIGSGTSSSGTSGTSSGGTSSDGTTGTSGTVSGSGGIVTSSTLTGGALEGTGISATGSAPTVASPPAGAINLASGSVPSLYTGTLPSNVSTYFVATMSSTGSTTIGQSVTVPTPPAGTTSISGTVAFDAWPSANYDPGTTITVMIGGVVLLSNYSFTGANAPYTAFNLPFSNLPIGNTTVSFVITNSNGTVTNSAICLSAMNMNYSYTAGSGRTAIDVSNLALYYPLDSSSGTLITNYAQSTPAMDASLCFGAVIDLSGACIGLGDASFSTTLGSYAQLGQWTCPPATTNRGFTVAGWFYPVGIPSVHATLCSLSNTANSISIFLNKSTMYLDFSCNSANQPEYVAKSAIIPSTWNFFTMTCTCTDTTPYIPYATFVYYLNDVSMATGYGYYPDTATTYTKNYLGGLPAGSALNLGSFNGRMDDFRVYNRVLSGTEIQGLWSYGMISPDNTSSNIIDTTGLTMYYPFTPAGYYPANTGTAPGSRVLVPPPSAISLNNLTKLSKSSFQLYWSYAGSPITSYVFAITGVDYSNNVATTNLGDQTANFAITPQLSVTGMDASATFVHNSNYTGISDGANQDICGCLWNINVTGTNGYGSTSATFQYAPIVPLRTVTIAAFNTPIVNQPVTTTVSWTGGYGYGVTYSYRFNGLVYDANSYTTYGIRITPRSTWNVVDVSINTAVFTSVMGATTLYIDVSASNTYDRTLLSSSTVNIASLPLTINALSTTYINQNTFRMYWSGGVYSTSLGYDISATNCLDNSIIGRLTSNFIGTTSISPPITTSTTNYTDLSYNGLNNRLPDFSNRTLGGCILTVYISGTNAYGTTTSAILTYAPIAVFTAISIGLFKNYEPTGRYQFATLSWSGGYGYGVTYSYTYSVADIAAGITIVPATNLPVASNTATVIIDTTKYITKVFTIQITATNNTGTQVSSAVTATVGLPGITVAPLTTVGATVLNIGQGYDVSNVGGVLVTDSSNNAIQTTQPIYTGTLPSTVSFYLATTLVQLGTATFTQSFTVTNDTSSGNLSFFAWPADVYDTGTVLSVTMSDLTNSTSTVLLNNYSFSSVLPYAFDLPYYNLTVGANITYTMNNTNGATKSTVCIGGFAVNANSSESGGRSVIDTSSMSLYYPLDLSAGTFIYNCSAITPALDASLCNGAVIDKLGTVPYIGLGDVSFSNTMGSYAQLGQWTCPARQTGGGFTMAGWFYPVGTQTANATLCSLSNGTGAISVFLNQTNLYLDFSCNGVGGTEYISTVPVLNRTWNFFVMTCLATSSTNSTCAYYINGVSVSTITSTTYYPNTATTYTQNYLGGLPAGKIIGANAAGNLGAFNGRMDDFRIYNRVLTFQEIQVLWMYGMNSMTMNAMNVVDPSGIVMYYPYNMAGGL